MTFRYGYLINFLLVMMYQYFRLDGHFSHLVILFLDYMYWFAFNYRQMLLFISCLIGRHFIDQIDLTFISEYLYDYNYIVCYGIFIKFLSSARVIY